MFFLKTGKKSVPEVTRNSKSRKKKTFITSVTVICTIWYTIWYIRFRHIVEYSPKNCIFTLMDLTHYEKKKNKNVTIDTFHYVRFHTSHDKRFQDDTMNSCTFVVFILRMLYARFHCLREFDLKLFYIFPTKQKKKKNNAHNIQNTWYIWADT